MNALTTAEAASVERVRQRYSQPGDHERGLKILRQERQALAPARGTQRSHLGRSPFS
jgi:hypothetical protein